MHNKKQTNPSSNLVTFALLTITFIAFFHPLDVHGFTVGGTVTGLTGELQLQNNRQESLILTQDGNFVFKAGYESGTLYVVSILQQPKDLKCAVTNDTGTISDTNIDSILITCSKTGRQWFAPQQITDHISIKGKQAKYPEVAINSQGDAIVCWSQHDGKNWRLFKSERRSGVWKHPRSFTEAISLPGSDAVMPKVDINDSGDAVIVWVQNNGTANQIFMSEYKNEHWFHPKDISDHISPSGGAALGPQIVINNSGKVIITWFQDARNGLYAIFKSVRDQYNWMHPESLKDFISLPVGEDATSPQVALNNKGNAILVWDQTVANISQIFKSEFRDNKWTFPANASDCLSAQGNHRGAYSPVAAISETGKAIVAWTQTVSANSYVYKSEFLQHEWQLPRITDFLSSPSSIATNVDVAMDDKGQAIITWQETVGRISTVFMQEYRDNTWNNPISFNNFFEQDRIEPYLLHPNVTMAAKNKALVIWKQADPDGEFHVFKNLFKGGEWTPPDDNNDYMGFDGYALLNVASDIAENGDAIIVWLQYSGNEPQIYMCEYRLP